MPRLDDASFNSGKVTLRQADSVSPTEEVQGRRSAQSRFRPDIEGLRAVAVLAVVLFHADVPGVGGGFVGVDVFFVISGFLITGLLWREASTTGTVAAAPLLRGAGPPTAAGIGHRRRRHHDRLGCPVTPVAGADRHSGTASPARCMSATTGSFSRRRLLRRLHAAVAVPALLVVGRRGAVLPGVAGHDHRYGVADPACASAHQDRSHRPRNARIWWSLRWSRPCRLRCRWWSLTWRLSVAFFSLPTRAWQLAAGGLVALTAGQWRRLPPRAAAITGWAGLAVILLACTRLSATTLYPGTAALLPVLGAALVIGAGCAAPSQGCGRVLALSPMRAIGRISYSWYLWHWPVLVLAPALLGHPLGLAGRLAAALVSGGLAVLTLRFIENPLRFAAPVRRSALASLALGGAATAVAVCVGVALLVLVPTPVGRGAPATPLTITAAPPPAGSGIDAYDAAVQQAFAQVQAAVAASADLKAVPSNLNPPLAGAAHPKTIYSQVNRPGNPGGL